MAGSLLAHCWKNCPDDIKQPENISAVDAFNLFAGCFFDCPEHSEASVIDENIDPAEAAYAIAHARFDLHFVRHVRFKREQGVLIA